MPTPGPTPSPVPAKAEKMSFVDAAGGPAAMGGAGAALLILAGLFALYKRRKYQSQYAREQDEEAPFDVDSPDKRRGRRSCRRRRRLLQTWWMTMISKLILRSGTTRTRPWATRLKEPPLDTPSPRRNSVTSYVARRKGRLVEWRPDGSAFVKWSEGDRFCPRPC